ncbi:MAG: hypothetical protein QGH15_14225 [Kiritimatiellia bacterium]|nr:hypothetical protein [Kiritimatiellia bacterium]
MLTRFAAQTQRQVAGHLDMGTGGAVSTPFMGDPARPRETEWLKVQSKDS